MTSLCWVLAGSLSFSLCVSFHRLFESPYNMTIVFLQSNHLSSSSLQPPPNTQSVITHRFKKKTIRSKLCLLIPISSSKVHQRNRSTATWQLVLLLAAQHSTVNTVLLFLRSQLRLPGPLCGGEQVSLGPC